MDEVEELDELELNKQAVKEIEDKLVSAIEDQEKKLATAQENLDLSLRGLRTKFKTVQGFVEALDIYQRLAMSTEYDGKIKFEDVRGTQKTAVSLLDDIIDEYADWNLLDYSSYLSGYIEENWASLVFESDEDVFVEAADEIMRQTVCRAVDDPMSSIAEFYMKTDEEIAKMISQLEELDEGSNVLKDVKAKRDTRKRDDENRLVLKIRDEEN